jgi:hypothetical protein
LAELERLFAALDPLRQAVVRTFSTIVRVKLRGSHRLQLVDSDTADDGRTARPIFPVVAAFHERYLDADAIFKSLKLPLPRSEILQCAFDLGQPVPVGPQKALRVCLSAVHIVDVAERGAAGQSLQLALGPLIEDLDKLFCKWELAADELAR